MLNFEDEQFDEEYNHSEIDEFYEKVKGVTIELKGLQENLNNAEKNLK